MSVTFYPGRYVETELPGSVFSCAEMEGAEDIEVNVANANAVRVLDVLGLRGPGSEELAGQCDAQDFHGRTLLALAILPEDEEMPAYQLQPGEQSDVVRALVGDGATVWQGSRRAGYLQDRLRQLAELAEFCARHGHLVLWA